MNKKSVGILTFHFKDNFGAVLQCYALQEYLKSKGYEVAIINFKPPRHRLLLSLIKQLLKYLFNQAHFIGINGILNHIIHLVRQSKKFNKFRNAYLNVGKFHTSNHFNHELSYDIVVTGSDQIWNSIRSYSKAYFLKPFSNFQGKRIAYAACRGVKEVTTDESLYLKSAFEKYNWIGVRDTQTKEIVEKVSNAKAKIVCDPSMLIDFNPLIPSKPIIKERYMLIYILGKEIEGGHLTIIKKIKEKLGSIKIVACYLTNKNPKYFKFADEHVYDASPIEWLNLIKYSELFYTDSFHGVLFSIKLEKQFLAYYSEKKRSSRLIDISERFDLKSQIISSYQDSIDKKTFDQIGIAKINYEKVNEFIIESKEQFLTVLNRASESI